MLRALQLAAVLAASSLLPATAAGVFTVSPVRLNFGPQQRALAVTLSNPGDVPVVLDAQLYAWSQRPDGTDDLRFTEDVVLAPPVLRLRPRSQQVVRLALLRPPDPQRQLSYRMVIREGLEGASSPQGVAVPFSLALNIPVFVTPAAARWQVGCSVERAGNGVRATCENSGNAFAVIRDIRLERAGTLLARFEGGAYVLAGVRRSIELESGGTPAAGPARLTVTFEDDQRLTEEVELP